MKLAFPHGVEGLLKIVGKVLCNIGEGVSDVLQVFLCQKSTWNLGDGLHTFRAKGN